MAALVHKEFGSVIGYAVLDISINEFLIKAFLRALLHFLDQFRISFECGSVAGVDVQSVKHSARFSHFLDYF